MSNNDEDVKNIFHHEVEYLDKESGETFWWPQCQKEGCQHGICFRLSENYCYPHSAWYRPVIAKYNAVINWIEDLLERLRQK